MAHHSNAAHANDTKRFEMMIQSYLELDDKIQALKAKKRDLDQKQTALKDEICMYMNRNKIYDKHKNRGIINVGRERLEMRSKFTHKGLNKVFLQETLYKSNFLKNPKDAPRVVEYLYKHRPIAEKLELTRKKNEK